MGGGIDNWAMARDLRDGFVGTWQQQGKCKVTSNQPMEDNSTSTVAIQKVPNNPKAITLLVRSRGRSEGPGASVEASFEYLVRAEVISNSEFRIPRQSIQNMPELSIEGVGNLRGGKLYLQTGSQIKSSNFNQETKSECLYTLSKPTPNRSRN